MFALGCVLFECLTGRPAFDGDHAAAVLAKILFDDAPRVSALWPEVPEALDALVARMLSKDPALRPRDGDQPGGGARGARAPGARRRRGAERSA